MWADLVAWFQSPAGARVLQTAVVPAVAILVAGVLAALIGRAAVRSAIARADRDQAATAVAGLVEAARAAADADGSRSGRRRVARLRTESDVRVRLLPLRGSTAAADWAALRTEELQARSADGPVDADLRDLRDRLIAWIDHPGRAKRLFAVPAQAAKPAGGTARRAEVANEAAAPEPPPAVEAVPEDEDPAGPVRASGDDVPAWRRTRSAERLQEERAAARRQAEPVQADDETIRTAPVALQHPHPVSAVPATASADSADGEAHQPARHARAEDEEAAAAAPATSLDPEPTPDRSGVPSWLDQYDDEAQVTQNMDLKTPPPIAATSVRDRSPSGETIVPRP